MPRGRSLHEPRCDTVLPRRSSSLIDISLAQDVPDEGASSATARHPEVEAASPKSKLRNVVDRLKQRKQNEVFSCTLRRKWEEQYRERFPFSLDEAAKHCKEWDCKVMRGDLNGATRGFTLRLSEEEQPAPSERDLRNVEQDLRSLRNVWHPDAAELKPRTGRRQRRAAKGGSDQPRRTPVDGAAAARQPRSVDSVAELLQAHGASCRGMVFSVVRASLLQHVKRGLLGYSSGKLTYAAASEQARTWRQRNEAAGRQLPYKPEEQREAMEVLRASAVSLLEQAASRSMRWGSLVEELQVCMTRQDLCYTRMGCLFEYNSWGDVLKKSLDADSVFQIGPGANGRHDPQIHLKAGSDEKNDCLPDKSPQEDSDTKECSHGVVPQEPAVPQHQRWADMEDDVKALQEPAELLHVAMRVHPNFLKSEEAEQAMRDLKKSFKILLMQRKVFRTKNQDDQDDTILRDCKIMHEAGSLTVWSLAATAAYISDQLIDLESVVATSRCILFSPLKLKDKERDRQKAREKGIKVAETWCSLFRELTELLQTHGAE